MDFNCFPNRAEFKSDLLVEMTCHYQRHHFLFPRCERIKLFLQSGKFSPLASRRVISSNGLSNRVEQVLILKGLSEELSSAGLHGLYRHCNISMSGNEDYGEGNLSRRHLFL